MVVRRGFGSNFQALKFIGLKPSKRFRLKIERWMLNYNDMTCGGS